MNINEEYISYDEQLVGYKSQKYTPETPPDWDKLKLHAHQYTATVCSFISICSTVKEDLLLQDRRTGRQTDRQMDTVIPLYQHKTLFAQVVIKHVSFIAIKNSKIRKP